MTPDHDHGEVLTDLVADHRVVSEHVVQGSLVRAFRNLAEKVEDAVSAGAAASSPRVMAAFVAGMAAWQLAYLRGRDGSGTPATVGHAAGAFHNVTSDHHS